MIPSAPMRSSTLVWLAFFAIALTLFTSLAPSAIAEAIFQCCLTVNRRRLVSLPFWLASIDFRRVGIFDCSPFYRFHQIFGGLRGRFLCLWITASLELLVGILFCGIEHSSISYKCRLGLRAVMREDGSFILEGRKERRELKLILPFPSFSIPIAHVCCF